MKSVFFVLLDVTPLLSLCKNLQALDEAIKDLEYGAVNVNIDTKAAIMFACLRWGAYRGTLSDLQSGIGVVSFVILCSYSSTTFSFVGAFIVPGYSWGVLSY